MRVGGRGKKATQASSCRRSSCSSCCRSSSGGSSSRATHKVPVGEQTLYSAHALIRLHGHRDNALRAATHTGEWGATGIPREGSHRRAGGSSSSSEGRTELRTFTSRTQPPPPPPSTPSPMSGPPGRGDVASRVGSSTSAARPLMAAALHSHPRRSFLVTTTPLNLLFSTRFLTLPKDPRNRRSGR